MEKQVPENPVQKNRVGESSAPETLINEAMFEKDRAADFNPLVVITALIVCCYLAANIMAVKIMDVFGTALFDAGTLIFPFSYMLGDVLAEIWGFKTARKVIFLAFLCNVILVGATALAVIIPSPEYLSETGDAYNIVFGYMPRIVAASLCAFLAGELSNAWLMVKIRALTGSERLWVRTIGSSALGHLLDTLIFCVIAFAGTVTLQDMIVMIVSLYAAKLLIEAAAGTPIAYAVIGYLRKKL